MVPRPAFKVVVQGTGYVGLPAALLLADSGLEVVGVDVDENVVTAINDGVLHIDEAELHEVMARPGVRANLSGSGVPVPADVFLVAVPTPIDHATKTADLSILRSALHELVPVLGSGNLVIIESTIPPGVCRNVAAPILEKSGLVIGDTLHLAHCPERILPGNVFREIVHNDRIIGCDSEVGTEIALTLYERFVRGDLLTTDTATAELAKLIENASRDVSLAFANEVAEMALALDVKPSEVIELANRHPRVNILHPGIGVGGHCIPVDPWFIVEADPVNSTMIQASRLVNDARPQLMARRIRAAAEASNAESVVLAGLTYKADCEDMRESPALEIAKELEGSELNVVLFDPLVPAYGSTTLQQAAAGADIIVVLVPHADILAQLNAIETGSDGPTVMHLP